MGNYNVRYITTEEDAQNNWENRKTRVVRSIRDNAFDVFGLNECSDDIKTYLSEQLADTVKSRGKVISSTSIAVRQSLTFGTTFLRGMRDLIAPEVPDGLIIAEGVRFQSRIACGLEFLKVDDVLTSDELLDLLALDPITCDVDPQAMVDALKAEPGRYTAAIHIGGSVLKRIEFTILDNHIPGCVAFPLY